ncbi:MAG: ribonuclease P protein component [Actinomycetota bacterium]|nr:ribonuclease P protein component [Actinomycetota bacterium]
MPPSIEALSGKASFRRVYSEGRRCTRDGVTAIVYLRETGPARLGLAVGKAHGNAVVRNRIRRRLRAAFRAYRPGPADVILVGRAGVGVRPFAEVEEYVSECLTRAGIPRSAA